MRLDKIKVIVKSLFGEKGTLKAGWKLISSCIGYISSIFAFAVLLKELFGFAKAEELCRKYWWVLIIIGLIAALVHNHQKISYRGTFGDLPVTIKVDDLFHVKADSYVIPTNTYFRTVMDDEYISPQSVQGAFQECYFKDNLQELDQKIENALQQKGCIGVESSDIHSPAKRYAIGTVARIDHLEKHYYFVAVSDVNEFGKTINTRSENIDIALDSLLDAIGRIGCCDDLAMPLIGTGRAAIKDATIEKITQKTVEKFIDSNTKISRSLTICIRPKDYLEGKVDLKKIKLIIDYLREFGK